MELEEFIGQEDIKKNLLVFIEAAKKKKKALDHVMLYGPPGLGKTTMADLIAKNMGGQFIVVSAPSFSKKSELASILVARKKNDILFIDEIHRLRKDMEEMLYTVMENSRLDLILGQNNSAKSMSIPLPNFTIIGATTLYGLMSTPLRHRFGITFKFDYYSDQCMALLLKKKFHEIIDIEDEAYYAIAKVSRGIPRLGIKYLYRIVDYCQVTNTHILTKENAIYFLEQLGIDSHGLDILDRKYLELMAKKFSGGPVGIETLASSLEESIDTIENVVEPYLMRMGYIRKSSKGRSLSEHSIQLIKNKQFSFGI